MAEVAQLAVVVGCSKLSSMTVTGNDEGVSLWRCDRGRVLLNTAYAGALGRPPACVARAAAGVLTVVGMSTILTEKERMAVDSVLNCMRLARRGCCDLNLRCHVER